MHIKGIRFTHLFLILTIVLLLVSLSTNHYFMNDRQVIKRFNDIYAKSQVWRQTAWLGILSVQTPCDNWMMQEIIYEIKPDFIIETGTYLGGTSYYYAMVLDQVNKNGKILSVDIKDFRDKKVFESELYKERVEFIEGDSVAQETSDTIRERVKNHKSYLAFIRLFKKNKIEIYYISVDDVLEAVEQYHRKWEYVPNGKI